MRVTDVEAFKGEGREGLGACVPSVDGLKPTYKRSSQQTSTLSWIQTIIHLFSFYFTVKTTICENRTHTKRQKYRVLGKVETKKGSVRSEFTRLISKKVQISGSDP